MIISAQNTDQLILSNIVKTLKQVRLGGGACIPLIIQGQGDISVDFYVDAAKTKLLFSDNSTDSPAQFTTSGTITKYVPEDIKMNYTNEALSDVFCQELYYVTVTLNGEEVNQTYRNEDNLLFNVIVSTKPNPQFSTNDDTAIIVPVSSVEEPRQNMYISYIFQEFDVYLQLTAPNLTDLSELERVNTGYLATNILRRALYFDPTRGHLACFYNKDLDGTSVQECKSMSSSGLYFQGCARVKTVYMCGNVIPAAPQVSMNTF